MDTNINGVYPIIRLNNSKDEEIVGIELFVWDYTDKNYSHGEVKDLYILLDSGKLIIDMGTAEKSKDYFLDLMSKLYDMAEVK